ncbi:MAG: hypothetical protein ABJP25_17300, partial [Sneathiella sp.]
GGLKSIIKPLNSKLTRDDLNIWLIFIFLAVFGVNGFLTIALSLLDDRLAMAILLSGISIVYIVHQPKNVLVWVSAVMASGGMLLLVDWGEFEKIPLTNELFTSEFFIGSLCALVSGIAQGVMLLRDTVLPKNIDAGIALGSAFLIGGMLVLGGVGAYSPSELLVLQDNVFMAAMFFAAVFTVVGWLIFGYLGNRMTDVQRAGAAAMEPIGATISEVVVRAHKSQEPISMTALIKQMPTNLEWLGVALIFSAACMRMFEEDKEKTQG